MNRARVVTVVATLAASVLTARAAEAQYTFTPISVPGAVFTVPTGVNNSGQIVGGYLDAAGIFYGFLYSAGTYTTISAPGAAFTFPWGINNAGRISGYYGVGTSEEDLVSHGFLYDAGTLTTFDRPAAAATEARGLNDAGQIVGEYFPGPGCSNGCGFLYSGGVFTTIRSPFPGTNLTIALDINNTGQVVGQYSTADDRVHGFLLNAGVFTQIQPAGATESGASGINDAGWIVGDYKSSGLTHGFLYRGGTYTPFDAPGASQTALVGINDLGQLTGMYRVGAGDLFSAGTFGFLATPLATPEPTSLALLATGVGVLGVVTRRRRPRA